MHAIRTMWINLCVPTVPTKEWKLCSTEHWIVQKERFNESESVDAETCSVSCVWVGWKGA